MIRAVPEAGGPSKPRPRSKDYGTSMACRACAILVAKLPRDRELEGIT